ncbi:MAG: peroxiredoxin [Candidatus Pacebacteria bacterium]|nr:peroxiredoxin [Candidatus Paceibacterota bacterium]
MENTAAPLFITHDHTGETIDLSQLQGKKVLLYFYPKDMTPGCSIEAQGFQDLYKEFQSLNTEILALSLDSKESHQKFCDAYGIEFPLLMDTDAKIASQYGVVKEKTLFGKTSLGIVRESFLINEQGVIIKHWKNVKPLEHPSEVLSFIKNQ